ncbi:hypothetical protein [Carboxylicivirga sp. N1Y90]|uniref:hypothetical protein n=1 Tax=Carboxylicivirga fragile TaxID=3417571 RepID=UPI003D353BF7|nr:hypothetical protein [Marinilabiliaceae bacterium N1Y90]
MMTNDEKVINHYVQFEREGNTRWRLWGYSIKLGQFSQESPGSCDFCKERAIVFYKNTCHCGLHDGFDFFIDHFGLNSTWAPDNGDYAFYCCVNCIDQLSKLIQKEDKALLNHELLTKVICEMKQRHKN